MNPRDIATQVPPQEPDPYYMAEDAKIKIRTIENTAAILEHRLVETLLDIMENGSERGRLSALDHTAEVLGKKQKQQVLITDQVNVQNNNFLSHFKRQALGAPNAPTRNLPSPFSNDTVDARDADIIDNGDDF